MDNLADFINREEFFFDNCVAINEKKVVCFRQVDDRIQLDEESIIDESNLTSIFNNFSLEIDGSVYAGGEASAHSSCGFFIKKQVIAWIGLWLLWSLNRLLVLSVVRVVWCLYLPLVLVGWLKAMT